MEFNNIMKHQLKGKFKIYGILIFIICFFIQSVYAEEIINLKDIEQSEEYLKNKADIKYEQRETTIIRQISVGGIRVHDIYLVDILGNQDMKNRLLDEQNKRRITYALIAGLGLPVGSYLISLASSRLTVLPQMSNAVTFDISTFLLGTGGTIITIFGVMYGVYLINDITGIENPTMLTDKEAEELVLEYNQKLKEELIKKQETNSFNNSYPLVGLNFKF